MRHLFASQATKDRLNRLGKFLGGPGTINDFQDPISISDATFERLNAWRQPGESDDDLLNRICEFVESKQQTPIPFPKANQ